jgi:hypothetical protein
MRFNELITKKNKLFNSFKPIKKEDIFPIEPIKANDWRDKYPIKEPIKSYKLENSADDSVLNRMVQLKNVDNTDIISPENGKTVYDSSDNTVKVVIDGVWVTVSTTP